MEEKEHKMSRPRSSRPSEAPHSTYVFHGVPVVGLVPSPVDGPAHFMNLSPAEIVPAFAGEPLTDACWRSRSDGTAKMTEDHKQRSEAMVNEEADGLRTVEGLRGRLFAERLASKIAREEAELLSKRLTQLERLLTAEIEAKNQAERRLKCLLRKLESSKSFCTSSQSNASEGFTCSSSACFPGIPMLEGKNEEKTLSLDELSARCCADAKAEDGMFSSSGDAGDEVYSATSPGSVDRSVSQVDSWVSAKTARSCNNSPKSVCSGQFSPDTTSFMAPSRCLV